MKHVFIQNCEIGEGKPCFIIAEAGVNHNNNMEIAKKLIDAAVEAKVNAVKFQIFTSENVMTKDVRMASYQIKNVGKDESQLEMAKRLEMPFRNFKTLKKYCDNKGIIFLSTPHSPDALDFIDKLVPMHKIGSGDLTNIPFLRKVAQKRKPVILSTGMATLDEVRDAVKTMENEGNNQIIILHCTTSYPCELKDVNLNAMLTLKKEFPDLLVGYSDHTLGLEVLKLAIKNGATVIEKHFTLDKGMEGPDHKASLNPEELKEAVLAVKNEDYSISVNVKEVMGSAEKKPTEAEKEIAGLVRKSIVAKVEIPRGTLISEDMIIIKRPGTGIQPKYLGNVIGKTAKENIIADTVISMGDLS